MFGLTTTRRLRDARLENVGLHAQLGFFKGIHQATDARRSRAEVPLCDEIDAHLVTIRRLITAETEHDNSQQALRDEIDSHIVTIQDRQAAEDALATEKRAPAPVEHPDELWSLIDWSLWGSGMGDTFRERLADTFVQALTPEVHAQALELIRWWTVDRGREPLGRRRYEDQKRRLDRALENVVRWRTEAAHQARTGHILAEQLLATARPAEPDDTEHRLDDAPADGTR